MKLIKFIPAVMATVVLAACSTATKVENTMEKAGEEMKAAMTETSRTVVYTCQRNKQVVASYAFTGEKATGVTLTVNNVAVKGLMRDDNNKDLASFTSKSHIWNVENSFNLANFDKTSGVMLFQKGKKSDKILAKDCAVNVAETAKLNK